MAISAIAIFSIAFFAIAIFAMIERKYIYTLTSFVCTESVVDGFRAPWYTACSQFVESNRSR